ncbi:MAG: hypothetical protein IIY78_03755 [Clostridia bacterium]|nr:hypothetical protein [Clostridia bacterium]
MKKSVMFKITTAAVTVTLLSGCDTKYEFLPEITEERLILSDQDEIYMSSWKSDDGCVFAELKFDGDTANLTLTSKDISDVISGLAIVENGQFMIFDDSSKYQFDYKLTGSTLTLEAYNNKITFHRVWKKT